jgi:hypothetical protein
MQRRDLHGALPNRTGEATSWSPAQGTATMSMPQRSLTMIRFSQRRCGMLLRLATPALVVTTLFALPALALPFDPVPSAFQRWLNTRNDWPNNEHRSFEKLAGCSDQTAAKSPYRMAVFTCLAGSMTIHSPGGASRTCTLQRVSYFPTNQRVRVWTGSCR